MASYLENLFAMSLNTARVDKLKQMIDQDINFVEWCFVRWPWLLPAAKSMKPFYGESLSKADPDVILDILSKKRPDLMPYLDKTWFYRQIEYGKKRLKTL